MITDSWALLRAATGGDREAFGRFYDRHVEVLFTFVVAQLDGDRPLTEMITGDTFLRALTHPDPGQDVGVWLATIALEIIGELPPRHRAAPATEVER